jgi:carotenoid cleavage dioxygenase-like enzyme
MSATDPKDRPAWVDGIDNPYLHGSYTPVTRETPLCDVDLDVEGEIPDGLFGSYVRNGPNPVYAPQNLYHWFDGDGMVHAVHFAEGRARYASAWVHTAGFEAETAAGHALWPGMMGPLDVARPDGPIKDTSNTDLLFHRGKLLSLWYVAGDVYGLDPLTLKSCGREDFGGALHSTVSAHPKVDERTGELLYFTYGDEAPYMRYGVVSPQGQLVHEVPIDLPGPRLPHDLTFTEHYSILHDFPYFHDIEVLRKHGRRVVKFHRDLPSRFGVLPRRGASDEVTWFEFEPGYVLHMVNAWEDGDWIVMDGCRQPDPTIHRNPDEGKLAAMLGYFRIRAHLHRWEMNLRTGETRDTPLDDFNVEFCLPDTLRYGQKTRFSYHQHLPHDNYTLDFHGLVKYDHEDGTRTRFDYGDGIQGSESPFAPAPNATNEDDGWVVTFTSDATTHRSECWVFDARDIERGPVAKVKLPSRVPVGFHAKWIPGEKYTARTGS